MDFNTVITAIGSFGFPIVACCAMAYFFAKVNDNYRNDIKEISRGHMEKMQQMTDAINNNTLVIQKLIERMDRDA